MGEEEEENEGMDDKAKTKEEASTEQEDEEINEEEQHVPEEEQGDDEMAENREVTPGLEDDAMKEALPEMQEQMKEVPESETELTEGGALPEPEESADEQMRVLQDLDEESNDEAGDDINPEQGQSSPPSSEEPAEFAQ